MRHDKPVLFFVKKLCRPVFTTAEAAALAGRSVSAVTQALNVLCRQGLFSKAYRGIWMDAQEDTVSPYLIVPFLFPRHRAYVSFISALHLYGIIEQIPQVITLASTAHTKRIKTALGTFEVHRIAPFFFQGFSWYKGTGGFLIAEMEKALVDCLYLSARKHNRFRFFPELRFPRTFSFRKARTWAGMIPDANIARFVQQKLKNISAAQHMKQKAGGDG